ncbi:MAG: hypothetical protein RL064_1225 [Bacteroidota bacterium]
MLLLSGLFFSSCSKEIVFSNGSVIGSTATNAEINNWIYKTMNEYYLWSDSMPVKDASNLSLAPMDYFYTILYKYKNVDRFSWIDANASNLINQLNGVNTMLGIKVNIFKSSPTQADKFVFVIANVFKDSPADTAGLKRGDIIMSVDGREITSTNYNTILNNQTLTLGMGTLNGNSFEPLPSNLDKRITKNTVQIKPVVNETILDYGTKKIGYFAYLQFLKDYDNELRAVFGRFKTANINELVIDLRYNGGGYVSSSNVLTELIAHPLLVGKIMNKKLYNKTIPAVYKADSVTLFTGQANNIGIQLQRVFILTSHNTASASELIINNLKPYMEVILIGENTYGKNVGSHTITDSEKKYPYGLQPITFKILNSAGQSDYGTAAGFTPQHLVMDTLLPYYQFGDPNETYLKTALTIMGVDFTNRISAIKRERKIGFSRAQKLTISDNHIQDRIDMWADPIKN